jgi:hypothetical protein
MVARKTAQNNCEWSSVFVAEGLIPYDEISYVEYFKSIFRTPLKAFSIGYVHIEVVEAMNLPAGDYTGLSDPFVVLELSGLHGKNKYEWDESVRQRATTQYVYENLNPEWNTVPIQFFLPSQGSVLKTKIFDWDGYALHDPLGHTFVDLKLLTPGVQYDGWFRLHDPTEDARHTSLKKSLESLSFSTEKSDMFGPAIHLRICVSSNVFGELCSYLWNPPPLVKPTMFRFDPNVIANAFSVIYTKVWQSKYFRNSVFIQVLLRPGWNWPNSTCYECLCRCDSVETRICLYVYRAHLLHGARPIYRPYLDNNIFGAVDCCCGERDSDTIRIDSHFRQKKSQRAQISNKNV